MCELVLKNFDSFKGVTAIGVAEIIGAAVSAFFWFYLAALIEPDKYGEITYILGIGGLVSSAVLFGTPSTITVYLAKKIPIESTFFFISLVGGGLLSIIIWIFLSRIDLSFLILAFIVNILSLGDLLGRKMYSQYARYVLIQKISSCILGITFYYIFGFEGVLYGITLSYLFYAKRIYHGFQDSKINFSLLRHNLVFTAHNYVTMLLTTSKSHIDKIIIVPILGFTVLGNYSLALQTFSVFTLLPGIVFRYLVPNDATGIENKKLKKNTILISVVITILSFILLPQFIPTFFPKYIDAVEAIKIIIIAVIPTTISLIFTSEFLGSGKSKSLLIVKLISLTSYVVGMLTLAPTHGIIGIAVSFLLSTIIEASFMIYLKKVSIIRSS
jgi:O-antigen/teichoic acid export membrane protein